MMTTRFDCHAVRERLHALLDDELAPAEYGAVHRHLDGCAACGEALEDLRAVGRALRLRVDATAVPTEALAAMAGRVVSLTAAEARQSLRAQLGVAFEDMRYVLAFGGALAATLICGAALAVILQGATAGNADSLASLMERMAARGTTQNPFSGDPRILPPSLFQNSLVMPVVLVDNVAYGVRDEDYAFRAVITPEGTVAGVELLSGRPGADPRALELLRSIHAARLAPARFRDGRSVAVSYVWLHSDVTIKPIIRPNKAL